MARPGRHPLDKLLFHVLGRGVGSHALLGKSPNFGGRQVMIVLATLITLGIAGTIVHLALRKPQTVLETAAPAPDYAHYDYGRNEDAKVVDIGTQPFGTPATFLTECLFHDRILQQQLAADGWKLREHGYCSGYDMFPYLDGRLDVVVQGDIPSLIAAYEHRIGIFAVCSQGYNAVIANRSLTPSEIKGLRIGYPFDTAAHFAVERTIESANLKMDDIVSVPMQPEEMEAALRDRRVDAVATWEPFISLILNNVSGSAMISSSDTYTFINADLDFADRHPAIMDAVLAAIVRAANWGRSNEENLRTNLRWDRQATLRFAGKATVEANSKWVNRLRDDTIDNPSFPMLPLTFGDEHSLQRRQFAFLQEQGILPAAAEWKKVGSRFIVKALPDVMRNGRQWKIDRFDYAPEKLYQEREGTP